MREFSVGSVLGRGFAIWLRNFVPFTLLSLVVFAPVIVWAFVLASGTPSLEEVQQFAGIGALLEMLLGLVATGAMTYGVFMQLRGQPASIGKCIGVGIGRLFPVLGVGILMVICIGLGFLALIVPGVILMCMLWVAVPVAVVERPGVFASLARSAALTKGEKGSIFGLLFLLGVINWVVGFVLQKIVMGGSPTLDDLKTYLIVSMFEGAIFAGLTASINAVGYHDLRVAKEGVAVEDLARVFD